MCHDRRLNRVAQADVQATRDCDAIFAVMNGNPPDEGVCIELGIAIALPVTHTLTWVVRPILCMVLNILTRYPLHVFQAQTCVLVQGRFPFVRAMRGTPPLFHDTSLLPTFLPHVRFYAAVSLICVFFHTNTVKLMKLCLT